MSNGRANSKINIEANKEITNNADNAETVELVHKKDKRRRPGYGINESISATYFMELKWSWGFLKERELVKPQFRDNVEQLHVKDQVSELFEISHLSE